MFVYKKYLFKTPASIDRMLNDDKLRFVKSYEIYNSRNSAHKAPEAVHNNNSNYISCQGASYCCLFELFLGSQLGGVSALFLAAVDGLGWKTSVALAADILFAVVLSGKHSQRRIVDSSSQTQDQV